MAATSAKRPKLCTCGPHPVVDLKITDKRRRQYDSRTAQAVKDACRSHGCFHLRLYHSDFGLAGRNPDDYDDDWDFDDDDDEDEEDYKDVEEVEWKHDSANRILRKLSGDLSPKIEILFDELVLKSANLDPNGGQEEKEYSITTGWVPIMGARTEKRWATYRGRTSESGAATNPEPKQSWEARRHIPRQEHVELPSMSCLPSTTDGDTTWRDYGMQALEPWTNALHCAAEIVVKMLGIKQNTVLSNGLCSCAELPFKVRRCCIDLLRVFRYDALATESDASARPGSSAHSDWGSLTIVWQDSLGGLQTYCHECDKWSDVDAGRQAGANPSTIELFVHVGDFLSLASGGEYPSPRHRVVCPLIGEGPNKNESRCSLVYFAYPPPRISLCDVEKMLSACSADEGEKSTGGAPIHYERYSLLHDQSGDVKKNEGKDDSGSSSPRRVYEKIREMSFDKVIQEKWDQVQRK